MHHRFKARLSCAQVPTVATTGTFANDLEYLDVETYSVCISRYRVKVRNFQVTGIDHVVVRTADQERALAFYRDVLGLVVEREQPELGLIQLRAGRSLVDLIPAGRIDSTDPRSPNIDHFALGITPFHEAALRAHLTAMHVPIVEAGPRYGAGGEGPSLYVRDPDGNKIELKGT